MGTTGNKTRLAWVLGIVLVSFGMWAGERRTATHGAAHTSLGVEVEPRNIRAHTSAVEGAPSSLSSGAGRTAPVGEPVRRESSERSADAFWKDYAADRYNLLLRGARTEGEWGAEATVGIEDLPPPKGRRNPTKYLVFVPPENAGLGNHMSGMMSSFTLSIATERVFLHAWTKPSSQCGATYADLFVPPFEPWSASAVGGTRVSASGRMLVDDPHKTTEDQRRASPESEKAVEKEERQQGDFVDVETWGGTPNLSLAERRRCLLDLTQNGVASGEFDRVFIERRGQDPRPDCLVLYVKSNQFFAEIVANAAFGAPLVGGAPLSGWLQAGNITTTLFAGLFRPVASLRQQIAQVSTQLFPTNGETMAAHARAWHLRDNAVKQKFIECLGQLATTHNVSTVVLATDIPQFELGNSGTTVVSMKNVERTGEGKQMRNTLGKMQNAVVEMFLVGKADIAITSPQSAFSALGAATGGRSTRRVGGTSCKPVVNEPEFHMLECGMAKGKWVLDHSKWHQVYPFVTESNRERCNGRRHRRDRL